MTSAPYAALARRRNGLPRAGDQGPLLRRLLRSPWTWAAVVMLLVYVACLSWMWFEITADREVEGGVVPGVNTSAIRSAAWYALSTLLFWVVVFLLADRFRPQRWVVWFLALGWGVAVATSFSMIANGWAAQHLAVQGNFDPTTDARTAIFIAPFVEEAAKATVLFGLAILARYRFISTASVMVLGGLSAAGFAFTENILYYARAIVYGSQAIDVGDAETAVVQLVWLRGFWTAFGHPLFTLMTAFGVGLALRTRSKVVRVLAPVVGFLLAAFLHMVFNSMASLFPMEQLLWVYWGMAIPLVVGVAIFMVRQVLGQGRVIRDRLTDYVMVGWLEPSDPQVFAKVRWRAWALILALSRGWTVWAATWRLQSRVTELAFLRDGEVKGITDAAAVDRAAELVHLIAADRLVGIADPRGLRLNLPRLRRRRIEPPPPGQPPSPLGSQGQSAVDPRWGPPQG